MPFIYKKKQRFVVACGLRIGIESGIDANGFQFSLRLKTLVDKKRVIQSRNVANSKAPANFVALFEGFQQFDGDLNKLQVREKIPGIRVHLLIDAAIRRDQ